MTHPAEPERRDLRVGTANPHRSLWGIDHPYLGPPEEGQPRVGRWQRVMAEAQPEKPQRPDRGSTERAAEAGAV
jgi:hypothetical protein